MKLQFEPNSLGTFARIPVNDTITISIITGYFYMQYGDYEVAILENNNHTEEYWNSIGYYDDVITFDEVKLLVTQIFEYFGCTPPKVLEE